METITLTPDGQRLLERHADWWRRKGSLCTVTRGAPLGQCLKMVGKFVGAPEAIVGIARHTAVKVFVQKSVGHVPLPVRCDRLRQVADDHLIQKDAERVDVRLR